MAVATEVEARPGTMELDSEPWPAPAPHPPFLRVLAINLLTSFLFVRARRQTKASSSLLGGLSLFHCYIQQCQLSNFLFSLGHLATDGGSSQ